MDNIAYNQSYIDNPVDGGGFDAFEQLPQKVNTVRISIVYFGVVGVVSLIGFGLYVMFFDVGVVADEFNVRRGGVQQFDVPLFTPTDVGGEIEGLEEIRAYQKSIGDGDMDGLSDAEEEAVGTSPELTDTDDDGLSDYYEVKKSLTDPLNPDTDGDGIGDGRDVKGISTLE